MSSSLPIYKHTAAYRSTGSVDVQKSWYIVSASQSMFVNDTYQEPPPQV